jgi:cell division control protein 6
LVAAVNCMALSEPRQVFARIIEELGGVPPSLAAEVGLYKFANPVDPQLESAQFQPLSL